MPADARRFAPLPTITGTLGTLLLALCTCTLHLHLHLHCALYAVPGRRARHNPEITIHSVCVCVHKHKRCPLLLRAMDARRPPLQLWPLLVLTSRLSRP